MAMELPAPISADGLTKDESKHPHTNYFINKKAYAILVFEDFCIWYGGCLAGPEGDKKPWIDVRPVLNSQHPAIAVHLRYDPVHCKDHEDKQDIVCYFYAACLQYTYDDDNAIDVGFQLHAPAQSGLSHQRIFEINKLKKDDSLVQYQLRPWGRDAENIKSYDDASAPATPAFTGIHLSRVHQLINCTENQNPTEWDNMSDRERVISYLYRTQRLSIYRYWPAGGNDQVTTLHDWMHTAICATVKFGTNWFYHTQLGKRLDVSDLPEEKRVVPRWLDRLSETSGDKGYIFPTPEAGAFALRMMIMRAEAQQVSIMEKALPSTDFCLKGSFTAHPSIAGQYTVALRPAEKSSFIHRNLRLAPTTRCILKVPTPGYSADSSVHTFDGEISSDMFCTGSNLNVIVRGYKNILENAGRYERPHGWASSDFKVCLALIDDPTPSVRDLATIEEIFQGQHRDVGLDIPALVLRCKQRVEDTGAIGAEFLASQEAILAARRVSQDRGLNSEQRAAFDNAMGSFTGMTAIQTLPGCGKTRVLAAIAEAQVMIGRRCGKRRPIIVCAHSDDQVDDAMDEIITHLPSDHGLEVVRFRGGYLTKQKEDDNRSKKGEDNHDDQVYYKDNNERKQELLAAKELRRSMWEFANESQPFQKERNADCRFYNVRLARIKRWAASAGDPTPHRLYREAERYSALLDVSETTDDDNAAKRNDRAEKDNLEYRLTKEYIQNDVDILCCTNNASAEELLREFGQFTIILQSESLASSVPDSARPLAVFKEHCQLLCLFGNSKQHNFVPNSKSSTEIIEMPTVSLSELVVGSGLYDDSIFALTTQYRMHPELSRPLSNLYYKGKLQDAPSTANEDRSFNTWTAFLQPLKPAWNGHRRLVFDISGHDVHSHRPDDDSSWANETEADLVCELVQKAIAFTPPVNGNPLSPNDFLVVVFYAAQGALITSKMSTLRINGKNGRVSVKNLRALQGAEDKIVIISFARNVPGKDLDLGFIPEGHGLRLALGLAKQSLVLVGNFRAWMQKRLEKEPILLGTSKMSYFGALLQDIINEKDGISIGDLRLFLSDQPIVSAEFPKLFGWKEEKKKKKENARRNLNPANKSRQASKAWYEENKERLDSYSEGYRAG